MLLPFCLFLLLAESGVTPINAIIAGLAFLNTLGIFGLIYHAGLYVGDYNRWRQEAEKRLSTLNEAITAIHDQEIIQTETKTVLVGVKTTMDEMKSEIKLVRKRSHDLSNIIARLVLSGSATLAPPVLPEDKDDNG